MNHYQYPPPPPDPDVYDKWKPIITGDRVAVWYDLEDKLHCFTSQEKALDYAWDRMSKREDDLDICVVEGTTSSSCGGGCPVKYTKYTKEKVLDLLRKRGQLNLRKLSKDGIDVGPVANIMFERDSGIGDYMYDGKGWVATLGCRIKVVEN